VSGLVMLQRKGVPMTTLCQQELRIFLLRKRKYLVKQVLLYFTGFSPFGRHPERTFVVRSNA
jgi:hypothetical protein